MNLEEWLRLQLEQGFERFHLDVIEEPDGSLILNLQPLDSSGDYRGLEHAFECSEDDDALRVLSMIRRLSGSV